MYGPSHVYLKADSMPETSIESGQEVNVCRSGNKALFVYKGSDTDIWLKCITTLNGGEMVEYLIPIKHRPGCFRLTARVADAKFPLTTVIRRENDWPIRSIVRVF